jgi:glyoxylase-like metal-dependent hydrolase (beta-lactamase superfamily II)
MLHHVNCGWLHAPPNPKASCHCLLIEDPSGLVLVDTGIGLRDSDRLSPELVEMAGFRFDPADTAASQIERLGFRPEDVHHVVLTHCDPDHAGGLSDFPGAEVHVSREELDALANGSWRYVPAQFQHGPKWRPQGPSNERWFGLKARRLDLGIETEVLLVPLFGHTLGHCGVAVRDGDRWVVHAGDAYYLRVELETDDHPVSQLAANRAEDDAARRASLQRLRRLHRDYPVEIEILGYHDTTELPGP